MADQEPPDNVVGLGRFPPAPSGSGPNDPTLETRLVYLEAAVDEVRKDVQALRLDVARIDGKISNLPTTFQLVYMQATIIVAVFGASIGLAFALLKFSAGH